MNLEEVRGAVARGWCHPTNEHKVMDSELALAIADEVHSAFLAEKEPYLGCATTIHLIDELQARAEVAAASGEQWPAYRTVD